MLAYARISFYFCNNVIKRGVGDFVPTAIAPYSVAVRCAHEERSVTK